MTTDNTVQLTGEELKEYIATRFPTQSKPMTTDTILTAAFDAEWFREQFADILADVLSVTVIVIKQLLSI